MSKRAFFSWFAVILLTAVPVFALDFTDWRMDGIRIQGTSIFQQSSNQAFNLHDTLMDASDTRFAFYWQGERQENGGAIPPENQPFGNLPPTVPLRDNRQ